MEEITDKEICQAVLDVKKVQEERLINGDDDSYAIEPCPTHCKVLQAASVINKYIDLFLEQSPNPILPHNP
jgi:hypothetical protein